MKTWDSPPLLDEVEETVGRFFRLLSQAKLDDAKALIGHNNDDWDHQIWSLWQDTYLIYIEDTDQEVADESFEGKLWQKDLSWLSGLGVSLPYNWDDEEAEVAQDGEHFFVNLDYRDMGSDVSADFRVEEGEGKYYVVREVIHIA